MLDGTGFKVDNNIRDFENKFGIGVYYKKGDALPEEKIPDLLLICHEWEKQETALKEAQSIIDKHQGEAKAAYLSQFKPADRKTSTAIVKRHIKKTWPQVQKVSIKTDVYAGGSSMDVTYSASEIIPEIESFVDSFQDGHFNSMEDIYEYSDNKEIIL